jgi:hypothetical protein
VDVAYSLLYTSYMVRRSIDGDVGRGYSRFERMALGYLCNIDKLLDLFFGRP